MRFVPIGGYARDWGHLAIPEHVGNLVRDFGAKSWRVCYGHKLSVMERFLTRGNVVTRAGDFGQEPHGDVIDHAAFIKCDDGKMFVLTMPYGTPDAFLESFDKAMGEYRTKKLKIREDMERGHDWDHRGKAWKEQIFADTDIRAVVVDDRYKIRENGDLAAIIATGETLVAMGLA